MSYTKYYEGGWQSGETGGTPITPEALNHMERGIKDAAPMEYAKKVGAPYNLLDNSDFRNPVNQRGQAVYTTDGYTIDRWTSHTNIESVTLNSNGITVKAKSGTLGWFSERHEGDRFLGKTYTAAVKLANGKVVLSTGTFPSSYPASDTVVARTDTAEINVNLMLNATQTVSYGLRINGGTVTIEWAALYEGEYTAETLPAYQPKEAELLECRKCYVPIKGRYIGLGNGGNRAFIFIPLDVPMRVAPTVIVSELGSLYTMSGTEIAVTNISNAGLYENGVLVRADVANATIPKAPVMLMDSLFALSADF